jgi:hypothetical protein
LPPPANTIASNMLVMPGLVPGIHVFDAQTHAKTWMAGTSPRVSGTVCA